MKGMTPLSELTHFNEQGRAKMVDVSDKAETVRTAIAKSSIIVNEQSIHKSQKVQIKKAMYSQLLKSLPLWRQKAHRPSFPCAIRFH